MQIQAKESLVCNNYSKNISTFNLTKKTYVLARASRALSLALIFACRI